MNTQHRIEQLTHELAQVDERLFHMELRRDYPPPGCRGAMRGIWVQVRTEEISALTIQRARLSEQLSVLQGQLEFSFGKQFRDILETVRHAGGRADSYSGVTNNVQ